MKALIALLATGSLFLAGCASQQFTQACAETQSKHITIKYGDSEIRAVPATRDVRKNKYFEIRLDPQAGYEGKKVTVNGVGAGAGWIKGNGKKSDAGKEKIVICTPSDPAEGTEFKYTVTIENVGELDPHVRVIN
jgi:hypothetical protein